MITGMFARSPCDSYCRAYSLPGHNLTHTAVHSLVLLQSLATANTSRPAELHLRLLEEHVDSNPCSLPTCNSTLSRLSIFAGGLCLKGYSTCKINSNIPLLVTAVTQITHIFRQQISSHPIQLHQRQKGFCLVSSQECALFVSVRLFVTSRNRNQIVERRRTVECSTFG